MDSRNLSTDEIARRRALANACVRRHREKKRKLRAEQLLALAQSENLTDEMKNIKKQQIEEEKTQRRKELARERSRRYRERRRTDTTDTIDLYIQDSQDPGPSHHDTLFMPQSPSQPILEIKTEIESDNEEEDNTQYLDNTQSEVALENVKVEYDVDIEDHFNQYVAKKQKLSEEVKSIEDKEKYKTMSDLTPNVSQPHNVDNYDAFGVYIATLLRALPPKKALAVQPKIVELIVSANIEEHLQS